MAFKFRRGTEAERIQLSGGTEGAVPANGEPLWVTDTNKLYIGDGSTFGGVFPFLSEYGSYVFDSITCTTLTTTGSSVHTTGLYSTGIITGTSLLIDGSSNLNDHTYITDTKNLYVGGDIRHNYNGVDEISSSFFHDGVNNYGAYLQFPTGGTKFNFSHGINVNGAISATTSSWFDNSVYIRNNLIADYGGTEGQVHIDVSGPHYGIGINMVNRSSGWARGVVYNSGTSYYGGYWGYGTDGTELERLIIGPAWDVQSGISVNISNGNVGIMKLNPNSNYALDVNGNINSSGIIYSGGVDIVEVLSTSSIPASGVVGTTQSEATFPGGAGAYWFPEELIVNGTISGSGNLEFSASGSQSKFTNVYVNGNFVANGGIVSRSTLGPSITFSAYTPDKTCTMQFNGATEILSVDKNTIINAEFSAQTYSGITVNKSTTILDPTSSEDITMFYTNRNVNIDSTHTVIIGTGSPSVSWEMFYATDRSAAGTSIVASTADNETTGSGDTMSVSVDSGNWIWIETSATGGTSVDQFHITLTYKET